MAHLNTRSLSILHNFANGVPILKLTENFCRAGRIGNAHKLSFSGFFQHAKSIRALVHFDIVGPLPRSYPDGFRYACTLLDDYSRYLLIGCMTQRQMLHQVFKIISQKFKLIRGERISRLHTDGAKEYVALQRHLRGTFGELKSFSPPCTPELNIIAERANRKMKEAARAF